MSCYIDERKEKKKKKNHHKLDRRTGRRAGAARLGGMRNSRGGGRWNRDTSTSI